MSEILNNYKRWKPILVPMDDEYIDFVLSLDTTPSYYGDGLSEKCLAAYIDLRNEKCLSKNGISSIKSYDNAICQETHLDDIGLTGMDNGFISFDKNTITDKEYYNLLTNSQLIINEGDNVLHLNKVTGNTKVYSYDSEEMNGYYALKGGFFQGFYKAEGFDYEILPQYIEDEWNLEFVIRPQDYKTKNNILNKLHPENSGIFFFMGARAENKFAQLYGDSLNEYLGENACENVKTGKYFEDSNITVNQEQKKRYSQLRYIYDFFDWHSIHGDRCDCLRKNINTDIEEIEDRCTKYYFSDGYFDSKFNSQNIETSNGKPLGTNAYFEIETDNKYLLFDRTREGFTVKTWDENDKYVLTGVTHDAKDNLYLIVNRTPTGYTSRNLAEYYENGGAKSSSYNVLKDIKDNAFALQVKEDGSIGYKYLMTNCDNEKGYEVHEAFSSPGMIIPKQWNVINVRFVVSNGTFDKCGKPKGKRKMRIYFYVNGVLRYVSTELPEFRFRALNDAAEKQEGVPFNISLGGGTQGLLESIWGDYHNRFPYTLPLEQNFGGTFIGDIRSFKFYTCKKEYNEIRGNYLFETKA